MILLKRPDIEKNIRCNIIIKRKSLADISVGLLLYFHIYKSALLWYNICSENDKQYYTISNKEG